MGIWAVQIASDQISQSNSKRTWEGQPKQTWRASTAAFSSLLPLNCGVIVWTNAFQDDVQKCCALCIWKRPVFFWVLLEELKETQISHWAFEEDDEFYRCRQWQEVEGRKQTVFSLNGVALIIDRDKCEWLQSCDSKSSPTVALHSGYVTVPLSLVTFH